MGANPLNVCSADQTISFRLSCVVRPSKEEKSSAKTCLHGPSKYFTTNIDHTPQLVGSVALTDMKRLIRSWTMSRSGEGGGRREEIRDLEDGRGGGKVRDVAGKPFVSKCEKVNMRRSSLGFFLKKKKSLTTTTATSMEKGIDEVMSTLWPCPDLDRFGELLDDCPGLLTVTMGDYEHTLLHK
jgi:hypothetical protein